MSFSEIMQQCMISGYYHALLFFHVHRNMVVQRLAKPQAEMLLVVFELLFVPGG